MRSEILNTQTIIPTLTAWAEGNKFPMEFVNILPAKTLVVFNEDIPVYAVGIYDTSSPVCWMGFVIANPATTKEQRKGGLRFITEEAINYAKYNGYKLMFTTSNTPSIEAKLKECGFIEGDTNVNQYFIKTWEHKQQ
jgi:hypothetical protein